MIIGISGMPAGGKDTVAEYLEGKGFKHISLSQILREILTERGLEINMENLTRVGNSLKNEFSESYLAELALKRINIKEDYLISSIRQPGEIDFLRQQEGFKMVFVDADIKTRFERLKSRGRTGDSETFEQFQEAERKMSDGKSGGMNLYECKRRSDFVINNDGTLDDLYRNTDKIVDEIRGQIGQ